MSAGAARDLAPGDWLRSTRAAARERLARTSVVVLYGGTSDERAVSLVSGRAVSDALAARGRPDRGEGPREVLDVEVLADGRWRVGDADLAPERALARLPAAALFFVGLHGGAGEDGTLQGFLELAGRAYTGSGVAASALCMDKSAARAVFAARGLRVAPGLCVAAAEWRASGAACLAALPASSSGWYVKPKRGGSSVSTFSVARRSAVAPAVERVLASGDDALVEATVRGLEATVGVVGNRASGLAVLPPVEIHPRSGSFFDYREKYSEDGAEEICPPRDLDADATLALSRAARVAFEAAGCEGYARVDFIVPDGHPGEPVVLEANTLPGFTPRSLLPRAAAAAGADFRRLCLELCALGLERFGARRRR